MSSKNIQLLITIYIYSTATNYYCFAPTNLSEPTSPNTSRCDKNLWHIWTLNLINDLKHISGSRFANWYYQWEHCFGVGGGQRSGTLAGSDLMIWRRGKRSRRSPFFCFSCPAASFPGDLPFKACSIAKRASQIYHLLTRVHGEVINPCCSPRRWPPQSSVSSIIWTGYGQRRRTKPRTHSGVKRYPTLSILCIRSFLILCILSPGATYSVPDVCFPRYNSPSSCMWPETGPGQDSG